MNFPAQAGLLTLVIPAGEIRPVNSGGRFVQVVSSPVALGLKPDGFSESVYRPGAGIGLPPDQYFRRCEVRNTGNAQITCEIWFGYLEYIERGQAVIEPPTELAPWPNTAIAAGTTVNFVPAITGERKRRKMIIIDNQDPTQSLLWLVDDVPGGTIGPGEKIQLPVSQTIQIRNPTGAPVACYVSEIYWTTSG